MLDFVVKKFIAKRMSLREIIQLVFSFFTTNLFLDQQKKKQIPVKIRIKLSIRHKGIASLSLEQVITKFLNKQEKSATHFCLLKPFEFKIKQLTIVKCNKEILTHHGLELICS